MKKSDFTRKELDFLKDEFGIVEEQIELLSEDRLLEIADACFDIELEGDLKEGKTVSDRCGIASDVFSKINMIV